MKSNFLVFLNLIGSPSDLHKSSVWSLDFFALIWVIPFDLNAAKITADLHCAEPLFSKYLIGFRFWFPIKLKGKFLFFVRLNLTPNLLIGSEILLKSRFDKLLSPIIFILFFVFAKRPIINLPNVPEFLESITIFFL